MNMRTLWLKTYTKRRYRLLLHILFWILLLAATSGIRMYSIQYRLLGIGISAIAYYWLVYFILPLYFKKKIMIAIPFSIVYIIVILIIIMLFYQILVGGYYSFMKITPEIDPGSIRRAIDPGYTVLYFFFGMYMVVLCPPLIAKFLREIYKEQTKALILEKENVQLELNFLKSQVNPHFLFNTLNNIQSFIVNNEPEKSVDLIGKLSELMRFSLYDTGKDLIQLSRELQIIKNYIALERVRCEDRATIEYKVKGEEKEYCIPPHILLPFVENAFKHGIGHSLNKSFINISINIENGSMRFTIQNSVEEPIDKIPSSEGLGLQNVKRRLEHHYGNRHHLEITREKGVFFVILEIRDLKAC